MTKLEQIKAIHGAYVRLTGQDVALDMHRESVWFEWLRKGFTEADLKLVVCHVRKGMPSGDRKQGALKFSNLIGQLDRFEEDLAMARALARRPRMDGARAEVLLQSGREASAGSRPPRSAGEVLEQPAGDSVAAKKALEEFKKFKETL